MLDWAAHSSGRRGAGVVVTVLGLGRALLVLLASLTALSPTAWAQSTASSGAPPGSVVSATTSEGLYRHLADPRVSSIVLVAQLQLQDADWQTPLRISRNVTIAAHPNLRAIGTFVTLDCNNLTARIVLSPGTELRFEGLDLYGHLTELGQTLLLIGSSPNATVRLVNVVSRRKVAVPVDLALKSTKALPLADAAREQVVFKSSKFCFNTTRDRAPQCFNDVVIIFDLATVLPVTASAFYAKDRLLGGYQLDVRDYTHVAENVASDDCLATRSEYDCVTSLLTQLVTGPILIRRKANDGNLVKIVLALTVLSVAVGLFFYFRRNFRPWLTDMERRRKQRAKGTNPRLPDVHNVMFSGFEDDSPDWQILPMPVGLIADEGDGGAARESSMPHQFIQDLSHRPYKTRGSGSTINGLAVLAGHAADAASAGQQPQSEQHHHQSGGGKTAASEPSRKSGSAVHNGSGAAAAAGAVPMPAGAGMEVEAAGPPSDDDEKGAAAAAVDKDSDSDMKDSEVREQPNADVQDLMDELEELKRDIMAGINDTQLQILSLVGSGAFGTVYKGLWQGLEVAVKTIVFSASSENRKRALQEAALCQSIGHPNIVATYTVDVQPIGAVNSGVTAVGTPSTNLSNLVDWRLYIVQEYCDGGPLRRLVQNRVLWQDSGPDLIAICQVALEMAQALAHLHSKSIIHGDLNPNNVLLRKDINNVSGFRVKVADFGLSVLMPTQKSHMSNLRLGTPFYMSPETAFKGHVGSASDVFSLGVILWELYHGRLAGLRTPEGELRYQPDFPEFPPTCPPTYRKLAHRCLQKQPHNRLHASQVVQRLQEMMAQARAESAAAAEIMVANAAAGPSGQLQHRSLQVELAQSPAAARAAAAGGGIQPEISPCLDRASGREPRRGAQDRDREKDRSSQGGGGRLAGMFGGGGGPVGWPGAAGDKSKHGGNAYARGSEAV